jgi:hypothetical protein
MNDLSQASLEAMLIKIREHMDESGEKISAIPTYFMVRPADLEALGITADDVAKMIKEKQT